MSKSRSTAAKPFMFVGRCAYCGRDAKKPRGGVQIAVSRNDLDNQWVCLRCASAIATHIDVAVSECQRRIFTGQEFKFGKWRPRPKKGKELLDDLKTRLPRAKKRGVA
jgi:hypothetical protein